jgi:hypothetical protein
VNFRRLLEFNGKRMPFAAAQVCPLRAPLLARHLSRCRWVRLGSASATRSLPAAAFCASASSGERTYLHRAHMLLSASVVCPPALAWLRCPLPPTLLVRPSASMAEIEHFVNPADKAHPSFKNVADKVMNLFDRTTQLGTGRPLVMTMGEAVAQGTVNNETLGYFMARTQLFMEKVQNIEVLVSIPPPI